MMLFAWVFLALMSLLSVSQLQTHAVKLVLDPYSHEMSKSQCEQGLIGGNDQLIFTGSVDISKSNETKLMMFYLEVAEENSVNFRRFCMIDVANEGCSNMSGMSGCYCTKNAHLVYHFVVNKTANRAHSNGRLQVVWARPGNNDYSQGRLYLSSPRRLPPIYKSNPVPLVLVDYVPIVLGRSCTLKTEKSDVQMFIFCVDGTESPNLTMVFDPKSITHETGKTCVEAKLTTQNSHFDQPFRFSYQDTCGRSGMYSCMVRNRRCSFPKELRGRWKDSKNGMVTFSGSEIKNFHPCKSWKQCPFPYNFQWSCILKQGQAFYIRSSYWTGKKDQLSAFSCIYFFKTTDSNFTYLVSSGDLTGKEKNTYVVVPKKSPNPKPGELCVLEFKMKGVHFQQGTLKYYGPTPQYQEIGISVADTSQPAMTSLTNFLSVLMVLSTLLA